MTITLGELPNARGILTHIGNWSARMPGRLRNKLAGFEKKIANFRQRRWS
jgi:hypothetical protein